MLQDNGTIQWGNSADYGNLSWDTGYALIYGQSGNGIKFGTNGNALALTLDTSQNATFTGSITTNLSSEGTYFTGGSGGVRQLSITSGTNSSAHALHTFNIASTNGKYEFDVNGTTELSLDSSSATFSSDVTAGSLSKTSDTTISLLTAAENNSVLKFRESTNNYGFTQQYQGTGNYFELLRNDNSSSGNTVYRSSKK